MSSLEPMDSVDVHDPKMTAVRVARLIAEYTRALNYATLPAAPRLEYPGDVYMVLGELHAALGRLPQVCSQLAAYLQRQRDGGLLHAERGFPHAGNPDAAVVTTFTELRQAASAANTSSAALGRAQTAISGLSQIEPHSRGQRAPAPAARPSSHRPTSDAGSSHADVTRAGARTTRAPARRRDLAIESRRGRGAVPPGADA
jgi:hypothetical protein